MSTSNNFTNPTTGLISAEQLARLTGLSERRLRQLAQFGAIPRPNRHRYPLADTLRGIFRYYRQREEDATLQDEYPSFQACSVGARIPIAVLKRAKHLGCPALQGGRVRMLPFLYWYFRQLHNAGADLEAEQTQRLRLQNAKLELVLKLRRDEFLPADTVKKMGADLGHAVRKTICRLHLLAPSLVGMPTEKVKERLREVEREIDVLVEQGLNVEEAWKSLATEAERMDERPLPISSQVAALV
jgi:hypothetical protein